MKIVVALEPGKHSEAILAAAARLARAARAEVVLLNVVNPWLVQVEPPAPSRAEELERVRAQRRAYLADKARAFAGLPVRVMVEDLRPGEDVPTAIARVARDVGADILVVESERASSVTGLLLGSVASALLRISPCPVLIVRPDEG